LSAAFQSRVGWPLLRHPVDRQVNDFDNRFVVGKSSTVFEQLAQGVVQRLDGVGGIEATGSRAPWTIFKENSKVCYTETRDHPLPRAMGVLPIGITKFMTLLEGVQITV
jgi:hypothetical protein